jgi:sulfate adenylyltransferase
LSQRSGIAPHGGKLIDRIATPAQKTEFLGKADSLPRVQLDERAFSDLVMIAIGAFSPLTGFMPEADYNTVVPKMRLANGLPWSIPITLSVTEAVADPLVIGTLIRLDDSTGRFVGVLELSEKYTYDKKQEAINVYRTDDEKHPGVKVVYDQGHVNLAGAIWFLEREHIPNFPPIKSILLPPARSFRPKAGTRSSGSKPATRFTAPMNISKSARWKPLMAYSSTP